MGRSSLDLELQLASSAIPPFGWSESHPQAILPSRASQKLACWTICNGSRGKAVQLMLTEANAAAAISR